MYLTNAPKNAYPKMHGTNMEILNKRKNPIIKHIYTWWRGKCLYMIKQVYRQISTNRHWDRKFQRVSSRLGILFHLAALGNESCIRFGFDELKVLPNENRPKRPFKVIPRSCSGHIGPLLCIQSEYLILLSFKTRNYFKLNLFNQTGFPFPIGQYELTD